MISNQANFSKDRALFLDRDGVININHGYVHKKFDFEFIDGVFDLARAAHSLQYKLVVITNQAGIARGYYSEQQFHELTEWMCERFIEQGAPITKVYFSPYHPTEGVGKYKKDDQTRKPHPGMIFQAQKDLDLDLENSILIGDKATDIQAGIAASVGNNILFSDDEPSELLGFPYHSVRLLSDAISLLNQKDPYGK